MALQQTVLQARQLVLQAVQDLRCICVPLTSKSPFLLKYQDFSPLR